MGTLISIALSFFNTNKMKLLISLGILLTILGSGYYIYSKGYSNGSEEQRNKLTKEYTEILNRTVKENNNRLTVEFNERLKFKEQELKDKTEKLNRKEKVKKVIDKSKDLTKEECNYSNDEVNLMIEVTRKIK